MNGASAVVDAWSVHLPGPPLAVEGYPVPAACEPDAAHELLGRKGLLGKEPATRLALCAVHRALGHPPGSGRSTDPPDPRTAVVASSNLGNVRTVERVVGALRAGSVRSVSPLDAPNASSNIVASSVAIWFRFGGPNFMICSGATGGLDAVAVALLLLRADRADRVVVVGTEPADEVATALHRARRARPRHPLRAAAACVVLGRVDPARPRPDVHPLLGPVTPGPPDGGDGLMLDAGDGVGTGAPRFVDVAALAGDTFGAAGVVYVALAAALLSGGAAGSASARCGDGRDGWRGVDLTLRRAD
jgi:hypothetical protein